MSLLLDRPTAAAVQAVSQEATTQCQNRVAEFQTLLQETVQVHTRSEYLFQASLHFISGSIRLRQQVHKSHRQHVQESEGTDKHTLRLWLIGAASRLSSVDTSRVWRRIAYLLPARGHCNRLSKTCSLQLLQLVCEVNPAKVTLHIFTLHAMLSICAEHSTHTCLSPDEFAGWTLAELAS